MNLIDVLKAACKAHELRKEIESAHYPNDKERNAALRGLKRKELAAYNAINAHIARLESPELVEVVRLEICKGLGVNPSTHSYEYIAEAAIDAVLGDKQ